MEIKLTDGQQAALDAVIEAVRCKTHLVIEGAAGTGKSFLTKEIIKWLGNHSIDYRLAAPTHQAKIVLSKMTGEAAQTIHSLMKISPETYEDIAVFEQKGDPKKSMNGCRVLLLDEGSMVDDELEAIIMNSLPYGCILVVIGDGEQIQPVKHIAGRKSPFFRKDCKIKRVKLTEIMRQSADNPIVRVATAIRNGGWIHDDFDKETKTGVYQVRGGLGKMLEVYLSKIKSPDDLLEYRFLAYTNEVVNKINKIIRKQVYNTDEPFIENEYLVLQEPVIRKYFDVDTEQEITDILMHNGETVKVLEVKREEYEIKLPYVTSETIQIATLKVERIEGDDTQSHDQETIEEFKVIWDADSWAILTDSLREAAQQYRMISDRRQSKPLWSKFWEVKGMFTDTKSLGACTFHKSQGTTVTGACIVQSGLNFCEQEIQEQLMYVGVTRAKKWVLYC